MNSTLFIVVLAMLAMVNAAPVEEGKKNLQGLLDALADKKTNMESVAQATNLIKQQQDDDGSLEAEAQFFGKLARHALSLWANEQQEDDDGSQEAEAQFFRKLARHALSFWANKQQDDDNGNQADVQFFRKLARHALSFWANKQQDDDNGNQADTQFWGALGRLALKHVAPHAISYFTNRLG